ncbi:hypothetical protein MKW92_018528 [Papaver armeniacum]|nr:hypothetical protein MKW92_018528 [Papaver armeniacum]
MDMAEERLKGQAEIWEHMFAFVDSMALNCALQLGIPDIINSHGRPVTISEVIDSLKIPTSSSTPNVDYLARVMRLLVRNGIFTSLFHQKGNEVLYDLTPTSKWLLRDSKFNISPMILLQLHPEFLKPWQYLGNCVKEGGLAFEKAHGGDSIWDLALANPQVNKLFNDGMESTARIVVNLMLVKYKDGFSSIRSLVDVGGGTGAMIAEIVEANPHIQGINFDLPHVLATALNTQGSPMLRWILHDWSDENCLKILRNCYEAISKAKNGKVIIVDCVLQPDGNDLFDKTGLAFDLLMMVDTGGKERTEAEWKILLNNTGFTRYNIIQISTFPSIIEAFPE